MRQRTDRPSIPVVIHIVHVRALPDARADHGSNAVRTEGDSIREARSSQLDRIAIHVKRSSKYQGAGAEWQVVVKRAGSPAHSGTSTGSTERILRGAEIALAMQHELDDVSSKSPMHPGPSSQGVAPPSSPPGSALAGGSASSSPVIHFPVDPRTAGLSDHGGPRRHTQETSARDHRPKPNAQQTLQQLSLSKPATPPPWLASHGLKRKIGPMTKEEHAQQEAKIAAWAERGQPVRPGGTRRRRRKKEEW